MREGIAHGDHVCLVPTSDDDVHSALVGFVRQGLEAGDRVWCVLDGTAPDTLLRLLHQAAIPADRALAAGQLAIHRAEDTYYRGRRFEPARMVDLVHGAVDEALAAGFPGFRLTGEMGWAATAVPGAERLLEYEAEVHHVFTRRPAAALCHYDPALFDPRVLAAALELHASVLATGGPGEGMSAVTPLTDGVGLTLCGELDLDHRELLHEAVDRLRSMPGDVHLRLGELEFIDVGCAAELFSLTRRTGRLVLHDPPAVLLRLFALLGPDGDVEVCRS